MSLYLDQLAAHSTKPNAHVYESTCQPHIRQTPHISFLLFINLGKQELQPDSGQAPCL